jgi:hypothetical protein
MTLAVVAALCMVIQDALAVIKYQAAARNRGVVAAAADTIIWLVMITTMTISTFTLHGNNFAAKAWVVGLVSAANIAGNLLGTYLGKRFVKDTTNLDQDSRLEQLEGEIARLREHIGI